MTTGAAKRTRTASRVHERTRKRGRRMDVEHHPAERRFPQNSWKSGESLKADVRIRTGDPFITSESAGDFVRSRIARSAHEVPANQRKPGCTPMMLPDRAKSTWWTLNGRHTAKVLACPLLVRPPGSGTRRGRL